MAEPVNLNKFRKARARQAEKARAEANRAKFGRTKAQRAADAAEAEQISLRLDRHRRETDED